MVDSKVSDILHEYTGIDKSVFAAIPPEKSEGEYKKLIKEFQLIISILLKGNAGSLNSVVRKFEKDLISKEELFDNINSLIEYGKLFNQIELDKQEVIKKKEVQQELQHFWRIMGIDSLLENDSQMKVKRIVGEVAEIMKYCGNLERCALVVDERRKIHDKNIKEVIIDKNAKPEAFIINSDNGVVLTRKNNPNIGISLNSETVSQEILKELVILFEKISLKYNLEISIILFDYYLTNLYEKDNIRLAVWQELVIDNTNTIKVFTSGDFEILLLDVKSKKILERKRNKSKIFSGNFEETDYFYNEFQVNKDNQLLINDIYKANGTYKDIELPILESRLFSNDNGKFDLNRNYSQMLKELAMLNKSIITSITLGEAKEMKRKEINSEVVLNTLTPLISYIESLLAGNKNIKISLEAGHIHCDRDVSSMQRQGMAVGSIISNLLEQKFGDSIEIVHEPMVDEDHVVNRLDYVKYREIAKNEGFIIDELIFESSPLIRQISLDVYKYMQSLESEKKDLIEQKGDNVYIKINETKYIELLENIQNECSLGCVLFDTGLSLYRKYKPIILKVFLEESKVNNIDLDLWDLEHMHESQEKIYNTISDAKDRRSAFEKKYASLLGKNNINPSTPKYINAIKAEDEANTNETILINVLEGFYNAQQTKLNSLFKIMGLSPNLWTITFDEFGNLNMYHDEK